MSLGKTRLSHAGYAHSVDSGHNVRRVGAQIAAVCVLGFMLVAFGASPAYAELNDDIPGVVVGPSPIVGSLQGGYSELDESDVYAIWLNAEETFSVSLVGTDVDMGADAGVYFYSPTADSWTTDLALIGANSGDFPRTFEYTASESGYHFLLVWGDMPYSGHFIYTIDYEVIPPLDTLYTPFSGKDRYETAVLVSRETYPDGATAVVIATGMNWPDALGGAALAGATNGPILLTDPKVLPSTVASEIDRLGAGRAYILGGTAAVGTGVENALKAKLGSANVTRLGGLGRYETARLIAAETVRVLKAGPGYDGTAFVATGANFPDALGASPLAAKMGWPLYLIDPRGVDSALISAMKSAGVKHVFPLGGTSVVSLKAESDLKTKVPCTTQRLAGGNRYDTARVIATYGVSLGLTWDKVAIATGTNFPDALAGGVLQGKNDSVMLLTPSTSLDPGVKTTLAANKTLIREVRFLGGTSAVSTSVRTAVRNALE